VGVGRTMNNMQQPNMQQPNMQQPNMGNFGNMGNMGNMQQMNPQQQQQQPPQQQQMGNQQQPPQQPQQQGQQQQQNQQKSDPNQGQFQYNTIAEKFLHFYYSAFDDPRNRGGLANIYQSSSKFTFEGKSCEGQQNIIKMMSEFKFSSIQHAVKFWTAQPSGVPGGILIVSNGTVKLDNGNDLMFAQTFHIVPASQNSSDYWCHNDIFCLNYT